MKKRGERGKKRLVAKLTIGSCATPTRHVARKEPVLFLHWFPQGFPTKRSTRAPTDNWTTTSQTNPIFAFVTNSLSLSFLSFSCFSISQYNHSHTKGLWPVSVWVSVAGKHQCLVPSVERLPSARLGCDMEGSLLKTRKTKKNEEKQDPAYCTV